MKIGVRGHDYGRHCVKEFAEILSKEGYETVQFAIPKAITGIRGFEDITLELLDEVREEFSRQDIEIAVFSCYVDLSSPDEAVRMQAVDTFCRCMSYARHVGAWMVGTETACMELKKTEKNRRFSLMADSLKRIAGEAERLGMVAAVEPVAVHPLEDMETAVEVLDEIGSDYMQIIFDPANLLRYPDIVNQRAYWGHCLSQAGSRIAALHLKDFQLNEEGIRKPCALGDGIMDMEIFWEWVKGKENMPVIRDELDLIYAGKDVAYLRRMKEYGENQ